MMQNLQLIQAWEVRKHGEETKLETSKILQTGLILDFSTVVSLIRRQIWLYLQIGAIRVISVLPGSPASTLTRIKAKDQIISINSKPVEDMKIPEIVKSFKGMR